MEVMRQYIAADLPNPFAMAAEVLDIQNHLHNYSCLRNGQCRHGYPQPALSWAEFIDMKVTVPESVEEVLEAMGVAQGDGSTGELELCLELQGGKNLPARSPASTSMSTSQPSLFVETELNHHNVQHNDATQFENSYIVNYSAREDERPYTPATTTTTHPLGGCVARAFCSSTGTVRPTCPIRPLCSKKCPTYTAHGPCTYQSPDQHHTGTENFTATHMHHHQ